MPAAKASFWLKTPEEVTPHAAKIKMEIAVIPLLHGKSLRESTLPNFQRIAMG